MDNKSFNLTTDPWIKVIEMETNHEEIVSLVDLFSNAEKYRQLAGDMHSQDFAVMRLLLAILTTVYSRYDDEGELYPWLKFSDTMLQRTEIDDEFSKKEIQKALLKTWKRLYQAGHFSVIINQYLNRVTDRFNFFGSHPFYQVTAEDYDALVPTDGEISTGKGQVAVKQLNRRISESGHSLAIFAPKRGMSKNRIQLDELIRWVISYQNFTGVTDKTKIVAEEKFSNSAGWAYRINPVFAKGNTLFETLMLNLILTDERHGYALQRPVWEYATVREYIDQRKKQIQPDNLADLYTTWSRILHIKWDEEGQPTIFSAGIPTFEVDNAFIEPMTTWRLDKKGQGYRPTVKRLSSLGTAMWRNFGQYVNVNLNDDIHEPGLVRWLRMLKEKELIAEDLPLVLNSVALISDDNPASQSPAAEIVDDMQMQAAVLFDDQEDTTYWPTRIEEAITLTQKVGTDYYYFARDIGRIRGVLVRPFANRMSGKFYDQLNEPFKYWLRDLSSHDDRDEKIDLWKTQLMRIVKTATNEVMQASSPKDIKGIVVKTKGKGTIENVFTAENRFMTAVHKHLK